MRRLAICLALLPGGAVADGALVTKYGPVMEQCYQEAKGVTAQQQCIGTLSDACMAGEEDGETTFGMSLCLSSESEKWDAQLNLEYGLTKAWAMASDADDAERFPEFSNRVKSLRDAQRAWIAYRDAECTLEYSIWGAGSMRHIAGSGCIMRLTAERAIELRSKREFFQ